MYIIDIGHETAGVSVGEQLAVLSCQGFMNRNNGTDPEEVTVYTIKESWDKLQLETTLEYDPEWELLTLSSDEYLSDVCEKENFPKIIYSKETQHKVIPEIITIAGVLYAVPIGQDALMDGA